MWQISLFLLTVGFLSHSWWMWRWITNTFTMRNKIPTYTSNYFFTLSQLLWQSCQAENSHAQYTEMFYVAFIIPPFVKSFRWRIVAVGWYRTTTTVLLGILRYRGLPRENNVTNKNHLTGEAKTDSRWVMLKAAVGPTESSWTVTMLEPRKLQKCLCEMLQYSYSGY